MAKKETSQVYQPIQKELIKLNWPFDRIESPVTPGIPDLNICIPGKSDWWLELKFVDAGALTSKELPGRRKPLKVDVGLRREQYVWLMESYKKGRRCGVILRVGANWHLFTNPEGWELLKGTSVWTAVLSYSIQFKKPLEILQHLSASSLRTQVEKAA